MRQVSTEGREVRYWDFSATETVGEGESAKTLTGTFVKKPVTVSLSVPETIDEVFSVCNNEESRVIALIGKGLEAEAGEKAGTIPEGTWSPAMVSAAVRALKVSPQFKGSTHSELRDAVMRYIGSVESIKVGMGLALANLANQQSGDTE